MNQFSVPIVLLTYNRPKLTRLVLEAIRLIQPSTLLIVADGPRADRPDDAENCQRVRQIFEEIDWPCQVAKEFSPSNLGSRRRVASGISWAFSLVEEAIILEDDCLPDQSFFRFCKELLAHYRADQRVMHVGGTNLAPRGRMDASYLFSKYPLSWGWATWRRAWMLFDDKLKHWPSVREGGWLRDYIGDDKAALDQWSDRLDAIADERFDSWATIWTFSCWMNHGLSILPVENLVTNIGLGAPDATHTRHNRHLELMKDTRPMEFPLKHPEFMIRDRKTDEYLSQQLLAVKSYAGVPGFFRRLRRLQRRRQRARRESTS